jgi:hypothetical protein
VVPDRGIDGNGVIGLQHSFFLYEKKFSTKKKRGIDGNGVIGLEHSSVSSLFVFLSSSLFFLSRASFGIFQGSFGTIRARACMAGVKLYSGSIQALLRPF